MPPERPKRTAEEMLALVVPVLDREFPRLSEDVRREVIASIPFTAAFHERPRQNAPDDVLPQDIRVQCWTEAMRDVVARLLAHRSVANN